jgi:hypothetical protein
MRIRVEMVEKTQFEHITLFWQFVPSLSPRITDSPVRRESCSEPNETGSLNPIHSNPGPPARKGEALLMGYDDRRPLSKIYIPDRVGTTSG